MDANSYKGYCSRQVVSLCDEVEKRDNLKPTNLTITGTTTHNTQCMYTGRRRIYSVRRVIMFLRSNQAIPNEAKCRRYCASILYINLSTALPIPILCNNNRLRAWSFCDEPSPVENRASPCQCRRFIPFQFAELPPSRRRNPLHPPRCLAPFLPIKVTLILFGGGFVAIAICVCLISGTPGSYNARRRELLPRMRRRCRRQAMASSSKTTEDHSMHLLLHCQVCALSSCSRDGRIRVMHERLAMADDWRIRDTRSRDARDDARGGARGNHKNPTI